MVPETQSKGLNVCEERSGIDNPSVIEEAELFEAIPHVSKLEARLQEDCAHSSNM